MLKSSMFNEPTGSDDDFASSVTNIFENYFRSGQRSMSTESSQEDEIEKVWFLKVSDFTQFDKNILAENQSQWEYRLMNSDGKALGTERSREINNGERYELTVKSYRKGGPGAIETTLDSTKEMHDVISNLADRVIHKTRYLIPTGTMVTVLNDEGDEVNQELIWEVDAFLMEDGSFYPWVKVDLEVPHEDVPSPNLPFKYDDVINASYDVDVSEEDRSRIDDIFNTVKRIKE